MAPPVRPESGNNFASRKDPCCSESPAKPFVSKANHAFLLAAPRSASIALRRLGANRLSIISLHLFAERQFVLRAVGES